jgi:hypothetical protein
MTGMHVPVLDIKLSYQTEAGALSVADFLVTTGSIPSRAPATSPPPSAAWTGSPSPGTSCSLPEEGEGVKGFRGVVSSGTLPPAPPPAFPHI